jgi:tetratricopeptide (TPR) repeat protein
VSSIHVDDLDRIPMPDGFVWRPIRRHFGIRAFGVNAYTAAEVGKHVVEAHTENTYGHEEIYLVLRGRALFTVDGNEHELAAGQLVCVHDPAIKREAVALDDDTLVLAFGGQPGVAHETTPWEAMFVAYPAYQAEDWDEAIRIHEEALAERPDNAPLLFNLACMEARAGRTLDALLHLKRAVELDPKWAVDAVRDSDLDSIRSEPGFPAA